MVSSSQARVLAILDRSDHPLDASEIQKETGASFHGPVYVALKALEQRGFITREFGAGQRGHSVNRFALTEAGKAELVEMREMLGPAPAPQP